MRNNTSKVNLLGIGPSSMTTIGSASSSISSWFSTSMVDSIIIGARTTFTGSADGALQIDIQTSPDQTSFDTKAYATFQIGETISATKQKAMPITVGMESFRIEATNLGSITTIDAWVYSTLCRTD